MFLEIRDIQKSFGQNDSRVQVLKGVNMQVEQGDFCVLLGPSGSGKSTLLNIIGGIDTADGGQITIGNITLGKMNPKKLTAYRRNHLGYVFQMYNLIPNLTVRENIEVGAYLSKKPLNVDELCIPWACGTTGTSCPISSPAASSNGPPLAGPLSKTRIFSSVMSPPEHWTTRPVRRY